MHASDFIDLCKLAVQSGPTLINGKKYKQIIGLAQDNNLSPLINDY